MQLQKEDFFLFFVPFWLINQADSFRITNASSNLFPLKLCWLRRLGWRWVIKILEQTCLCAPTRMDSLKVCVMSGFHTRLSLSCWFAEESSWTPSCHATMWMECVHPLAREPDWAKGISHRHANSTNAPVRPKWQICLLLGFFFSLSAFASVCNIALRKKSLSGFSKCTLSLIWHHFWVRLPNWEEYKHHPEDGVVCHESFPYRLKRATDVNDWEDRREQDLWRKTVQHIK